MSGQRIRHLVIYRDLCACVACIRYYYGVIECESEDIASKLYEELDGLDVVRTDLQCHQPAAAGNASLSLRLVCLLCRRLLWTGSTSGSFPTPWPSPMHHRQKRPSSRLATERPTHTHRPCDSRRSVSPGTRPPPHAPKTSGASEHPQQHERRKAGSWKIAFVWCVQVH